MSAKIDLSKYRRKSKEASDIDLSQYKRKESVKKSLPTDVLQQAPIGAAKGALSSYGNVLELLGANPQEPFTPSQQERVTREAFGSPEELAFSISDEIAPETSGRLPTSRDIEQFAQMLGVAAPETAAGRIVGKGAEALGNAATFGPGGIGLAALGGASGEAIREAGGPEWLAQAADVGINFSNLPKAALSKKFKPSTKQEEVTDFLRAHGFSDEKIVPLVQDRKKIAFLSKAARKYEKRDPWLNAIKSDLGNIYGDIREAGTGVFLTGDPLNKFEKSFTEKLVNVPRMYRCLIDKEVKDLFNNPIDFKELLDFKQATNAIVKDVEGGKAAIGILKEPIEHAMAEMNSPLYKKVKLTDQAYGNLQNFTDKMTKRDWEFLISMGETLPTLYGLLTMNPAVLKTMGAKYATKQLSKKLLTSPRLQNMNKKLWEAFYKHDERKVVRMLSELEKEIGQE